VRRDKQKMLIFGNVVFLDGGHIFFTPLTIRKFLHNFYNVDALRGIAEDTQIKDKTDTYDNIQYILISY